RVAFVDPTVNAKTRSVRVRVEILNLDGQLRPGDYASARISISAIPADEVYDPALAGKYISPMHPKVIRDGPGPCPICDMDLIPTTELGYSENPLPEQRVITIPRDAVLIAGQNSVVYVESEPGRFETRRIVIAALTNEYAVVAEGLREGEVVATQGNFLLDSQSQLVGNPSLLDPTKAVRFAPGPLQLEPIQDPHLLEGDSAVLFDAAYQTYFSIQVTLAADERVSPSQADALVNRLNLLLNDGSIPDANQRNLLIARDAAAKLVGSIEQSRRAFRKLSHAMIRAIYQVRGKKTQTELMHYFCSMVPGGGGDWLQPGTELRNPYWGAEMLECGELVVDLALEKIPASTSVSGDSQD
ncbi:MAG: heavy metal-binding domain-containing protein, partial [Planctomycetota bacterium]